MNANLKSFFILIINLAVNGSLWLIVPIEYKIWAILALNLIQVFIAFRDPSYVLQQLGWNKERYLGAIDDKKWGKEIESV